MKKTLNELPIVRTVSAVIAAGFLLTVTAIWGDYFWMFDLFSHFRIQYILFGIFFFLFFLWMRRMFLTAAVAIALVVHSVSVWPYLHSQQARAQQAEQVERNIPSVFMFSNVYYKSDNSDQIVAEIQRVMPDVVFLAEVQSEIYSQVTAELEEEYQYSVLYQGFGAYDMAMLAKVAPATEDVTFFQYNNPSIRMEVERGEETLVLYAIHPHSPVSAEYTNSRNQEIEDALLEASSEDSPVLVLGDFNISPFSPSFAKFIEESGLIDTQLEFGLQPSWHTSMPKLLRIPIDHALVSDDVEVIRRELGQTVGSDHLPVIVEVE